MNVFKTSGGGTFTVRDTELNEKMERLIRIMQNGGAQAGLA